ncbi:hypothetical protein NAT47_12230 [Flavobacterium sp. HXWNR69]|uniref:Lipoprotein n=1 Tax=Flavobacterium fragile TaxID=2949085 RepID=A0ABT0TKS9_9FLAO|nr:hypothetical protein [Flavobacterium sp. HXWNR69]MCL9771181.1 hypothetical protein [Flavobacterium sp. HXWNR69]
MKKLLVLVASVFMLQACDDGDITLESFNFNPDNVDNCTNNNLVFNINRNEILILNLEPSSFINEPTPVGSPRVVNVNSNNQIIYRIYSSNVNSSSICSTIPPANPVVQNEWNATGGTIEIITNAVYATNGTTITGYTHNIKFKNVNFSGSANSFSFTEYNFGNYLTDL